MVRSQMVMLLFFYPVQKRQGCFKLVFYTQEGVPKSLRKLSMYNIVNADSRNLSQIFIYSLRQLAIICVLIIASFTFVTLSLIPP